MAYRVELERDCRDEEVARQYLTIAIQPHNDAYLVITELTGRYGQRYMAPGRFTRGEAITKALELEKYHVSRGWCYQFQFRRRSWP